MRLGSDPEVFLQNKEGKLISSIGYINADKWHPMQIPDMPAGFTLQEDNVTLEYGIPPAASADEFVQHIKAVMDKSLEYVPELSFSKLSCAIFTKDQMEHPLSRVFGCEPDFDAWDNKVNHPPVPPHPFMRSAGGHIHVETKLNPKIVVKAMDFLLGVPSTLMDKGEDRKKMYGKRGAYRPKPYGVEYRVLSNFWIFDESLIRWVWDTTEEALTLAQSVEESGEDVFASLADEIKQCINNNDKALASKLVKQYGLSVCY